MRQACLSVLGLASCLRNWNPSVLTSPSSVGFNQTLVSVLPQYSCTLFVPTNQAFNTISGPTEIILSKPKGLLQMMSFHLFFPAMKYADLAKVPGGTTVRINEHHTVVSFYYVFYGILPPLLSSDESTLTTQRCRGAQR